MEKETSQRPEEKKKNYQLRLVINVLASAILFVSDLYVMINMPENIPALVIVTILLLAAIYLTMDTVAKSSQQKRSQSDEVYESILKSEKASYLLLKKSFDELSTLLEMIDVKSEGATEEIINAQKALAKVIISREKENADALMNSNDDVVKKVAVMESIIEELKPSILQEQREHIKAANDEVVLKQEKLFIELNNMEASMKDGLNEVSTKLSGFQEEVEKMADALANMVTSIADQTATAANTSTPASVVEKAPAEEKVPAVNTEPIVEDVLEAETTSEIEDKPVVQESPVTDATSIVESMMSGKMAGKEDEIKLEEILSIDDIVNSITEEASTPDVSVGNTEDSLKEADIQNSDTEITLEESEFLDDVKKLDTDISLDSIEGLETDISLDNIEGLDTDISLENTESLDSDFNISEDTSLDDILKLADDPAVEEKPGGVDSNPNKILTPEEIAALLAGASEPEEEEIVEDISIEEPAPSMPDLSNPNKIMTPEEIAALLANM